MVVAAVAGVGSTWPVEDAVLLLTAVGLWALFDGTRQVRCNSGGRWIAVLGPGWWVGALNGGKVRACVYVMLHAV